MNQPVSQSPRSPLRYWICSTQRSGSTLLSDLLTQTGQHGMPDEYLDIAKPVYRALYTEAGGTKDAFVPWLLTHRASPNGSFGLKLHWNQGVGFVRGARTKAMAHARMGTGLRAVRSLSHRFEDPIYVWVKRSDRLGQAISHYRARKTNQWVQPEGTTGPKRPDPPFDADEIDRSMKWLNRVDGGWDRYFAWRGIAPVEIVYEALAADPSAKLRELGDALGIPITVEMEPRVERQGNSWSSEMRARYLEVRGPAADAAS